LCWAGAGLAEVAQLPLLRATLAESLRLYPQPPILIRRALGDDVLPAPLNGDPSGYPIGKGADIFISVWNLHRWARQLLYSEAAITEMKRDAIDRVSFRRARWDIWTVFGGRT
jgi:Cytochrome P450